MIFLAKNAIKNNKKTRLLGTFPSGFGPYRDLLASTTTASFAQQSAIGVFSLRGAWRVCVVGSWAPFWCAGFGCVLPRSPGVWHPLLLQKTWHFYLWNSIKVLKALAFFFPSVLRNKIDKDFQNASFCPWGFLRIWREIVVESKLKPIGKSMNSPWTALEAWVCFSMKGRVRKPKKSKSVEIRLSVFQIKGIIYIYYIYIYLYIYIYVYMTYIYTILYLINQRFARL